MATSLHSSDTAINAFEAFNHPSRLLNDASVVERQQRDERLTAIGEMTAEFAHQVRTPLASVMLYADQLDTSEDDQARLAGKILSGLNELNRMVNDMLGFAAGVRAEQTSVNVSELLRECKESIEGQLLNRSAIRVLVSDTTWSVTINKDAIKGALLNLIANADQACADGVNILLHGYCFGDRVHLCVTDDGPGIPAEIQPRLFDAFFTTRPQGTGLGLAVVKAVAAAHDGEVTVDTSDFGSSFSLQLPRQAGGVRQQ